MELRNLYRLNEHNFLLKVCCKPYYTGKYLLQLIIELILKHHGYFVALLSFQFTLVTKIIKYIMNTLLNSLSSKRYGRELKYDRLCFKVSGVVLKIKSQDIEYFSQGSW
jgi:hypothetical protein